MTTVDQMESLAAQRSTDDPGHTTDDVSGVLRRMCVETLGLKGISVHDDLLDLGVDSFGALRLARDVQERFGVAMNAGTVFELGTIEQIAQMVTRQRSGRTAAS